MERASVGAVVTAGGAGRRFGAPKQFLVIAGQSSVGRAVDAALSIASVAVVPVPPGHEGAAREALGAESPVVLVPGGETRALSVLAGLRALPDVEWVAVHDAARPFATPELFARVLAGAERTGAAIPVLPCGDAVKRADGDLVVETLDRSTLRLVQTPQVFRRAALLEAYEQMGEAARDCPDDAAVYEILGRPIVWVEGEAHNRKLTRPEDGEPASLKELLAASNTGDRPPFRVGVGYNLHPFAVGRRLVLGGVLFEGDGLAGDSDADVVAHAVTDAVLGAVGLGDLGLHFPAGDERFRGSDSLDLLRTAVVLARGAGYRLGNVDLTIAARRPQIAPRARQMASHLATVLEVDESAVNVKATSGDGLGFVGRAEGIAVHAVACLWRVSQ